MVVRREKPKLKKEIHYHASSNEKSSPYSSRSNGSDAKPGEGRRTRRREEEDPRSRSPARQPDQRLQCLRRHGTSLQAAGRDRRATVRGGRVVRRSVFHRCRASRTRPHRGRYPAQRPKRSSARRNLGGG